MHILLKKKTKLLQEELSGIENKIAYVRQHYNDTVLVFNNLVTTLPGSIFAGLLEKNGRTNNS
jgi:LemA protein